MNNKSNNNKRKQPSCEVCQHNQRLSKRGKGFYYCHEHEGDRIYFRGKRTIYWERKEKWENKQRLKWFEVSGRDIYRLVDLLVENKCYVSNE